LSEKSLFKVKRVWETLGKTHLEEIVIT